MRFLELFILVLYDNVNNFIFNKIIYNNIKIRNIFLIMRGNYEN